MEGHVLLGAPLAVAPSLDTIPGSPAPTPSLHEPEEPPPSPSIEAGPSDLTSDGGSRRSSTSVLPIAGSYFPAPSTSLPGQHSTSGASTPGERLRPFPLAIPSGTLENSIFSPDPEQGPSREDPRGQGRSFTFPLKPAFILNTPRRRRREGSGDSLVDEPLGFSGELIRESSDSVKVLERPMPGRRRSSTFSTNTSKPTDSRGESRRASLAVAITPTRSFKAFRRRRASISLAPAEAEYLVDEMPHWPAMVRQEERRISPSANNLPFSYQQPADSEYTLESVSTVTTVRPLAVSPRKSSLTAALEAHVQSGRLGLSDVPGSLSEQPIEVIIPDDMVIPHEPPPRRSSLDYGSRVIFELKPSYDSDAQHTTILHTDVRSILSTSHTGTDTSASADTYSPSQSSKEHPLSSASTSLSRSAKSGKEGSEEHDGTLSAVRLQRSLEWEARQNRHRMRLERRRMILLELVETEVAYAEDLKNLVQVYLPQLYALPSLSERSADLVARNSAELLDVHTQLAAKMVDVLKKEGLSYELQPELLISRKFERISRRLAALFVDEVTGFAGYKEFCAGSIAAATLVRHIAMRTDYDAYEKRCQILSSSQPDLTLKDMLNDELPSPIPSNRSRLRFRDFLIMPIQRVCRYPLLLSQLLGSAATPSFSPTEERSEFVSTGEYDVGVDIERALGAMRGVAEEADEARRLKEAEIKSATVIERMDAHPAVTPALLRSLGTCRLIGSLDVLHHHPELAPLVPPVKVKYLAAFLYRGYLVLAKVTKGKVYVPKHFLPLEVFELIDITEGFLPHSIRLVLREHNFDLAASCETEKEVWAAALCEARNESIIPPFELPASVSPFPIRSRRMSITSPPVDFIPEDPPNNRHTLVGAAEELDIGSTGPVLAASPEEASSTPPQSPTRSSFGFTPDRRPGQPSTILLRRASATQRLIVDRGVIDVFSESCSTARSKAQMNHALFLPDGPSSDLRERMSIRDSSMLRRRRSFLDARPATFDIAFSGEIRGSVIPIRQTRSSAGKRRTLPAKRRRAGSIGSRGNGNESSTEVEGRQSADETVMSDFGTLTGPAEYTRVNSSISVSRMPSLRRSFSNLRRPEPSGLNRRKTALAYSLNSRPGAPNRAKSMPASPVTSHEVAVPPLLITKTASDNRARVFEGFGDTSPVYALSNGLTKQADRPLTSSKWGSLRRSLSFVRSQRNSVISLVDLAGTPSSVDMAEQSRSCGSEEGISRDTSTATLSDRGEEEDEFKELTSTTSTSSSVPSTPKKKRNSRIFQSLSRFTPI